MACRGWWTHLGEAVQEFADESHTPGPSAPNPGEREGWGSGSSDSSRVEGADKK